MTYQQTIQRPDGLSDAEWNARASEAFQEIKHATPVRTGNLLNSWTKPTVTDTDMVVENTADYAVYVFDGTSKMSPRDAVQAGRDFLADHGLF